MNIKWATRVFLVVVAIAVRLQAQQTDTDQKLFAVTKAKAEAGNPVAQRDLVMDYAFPEAPKPLPC